MFVKPFYSRVVGIFVVVAVVFHRGKNNFKKQQQKTALRPMQSGFNVYDIYSKCKNPVIQERLNGPRLN